VRDRGTEILMKNLHDVLRRPLITEKSTLLKETQRSLCFEVHRDATKPEIKKAVETLFGVKVADVRVANVHGKMKRQGRFQGRRPDWKKAYVVLREGEKMVEFFDQA
jgi:large subunit ribosomal protein L23